MHPSKRAVARLTTCRRSFSSSSSELRERFARRCRLLDASRGLLAGDSKNGTLPSTKKRPLPTFPLEARHFGGYDRLGSETKSLPPNTPKEFHQSLCEMIRNAKDRVRIASLYVGPATSNIDDCEEAEMLEALSELVQRNNSSSSSNNNNEKGDKQVSVKIILDENRALRPVPITPSARNESNGTAKTSNATTSSAEAVDRAIRRGSSDDGSSSLHLFRVLPPTTIAGKNWLPNPLDEIAGVFHIKIYIVDDQLLLSGANLSREYFRDRMDRYLHLVDGANGLVDFYAELVEILCRHSNEYDSAAFETSNGNGNETAGNEIQQEGLRRAEFLQEITQLFQDPNSKSSSLPSAQDLFARGDPNDDHQNSDRKIVAVGVPTFQAPAGYFRHKDCATGNASPVNVATDIATAFSNVWSLFWIHQQPADKVDFVTDVDATLGLLQEAGEWNHNSNDTNSNGRYSAQLSSAYLNPTLSLLSVLQRGYQKVELLTAGKISHGFKPKKKGEGSQGTDWTIPSVFDKLVDECMTFLRSKSVSASSSSGGSSSSSNNKMNAQLFFWERPDWTFHAKGIWLKEEEVGTRTVLDTEKDIDNGEVAAVVVGSSNFGYRSFYRDMESNLLLVFPPGSPSSSPQDSREGDIACSFGKEWKNLIASSKREVMEEKGGAMEADTAEKAPPLPWPILKSIPYIKTFF